MNKKGIKSVLQKKLNDWTNHIDSEEIKTLVKKNVIITGGAIVSLLSNEDVKDYDVYFRTKDSALKVAEYYVNKFNENHPGTEAKVEVEGERIKIIIASRGVAAENPEHLQEQFEDVFDVIEKKEEGKQKYRPIFLSSNAITLSNQVQLVIRFYGEPDEIQKNYDFVHCTSYWTYEDCNLVLRPEAVLAILNKELIYIGSKYPICSVIRTRKFINRGYHINAGQYIKMLFQVSELNLKDVKVLEDQLVGVDSAYFSILIEALKSKQTSDPNFQVTAGYLVEIVDRIFN